jgi:phage recombination protein Bet
MATQSTTAQESQLVGQLVKAESSPLTVTLAERYKLTPAALLNTLIHTIFPHGKDDTPPTNSQLCLFLSVANEYDLNPFTKEIYAFPSKGGGIVPIVSIDGWITIVQRRPEYNGVRQVEKFGEKGKIEAVTTFIYRKDQEHPTEVTEYFEECERGTDPWKKWPVRMLRHKSYIQCARYAFGLAGIYDEDEAERIIEGEVVQATGQDTTLGGKSMSRLGAAMEKVRVAGQVDEQSDEYRESVRLDAEAAQNKVNEQRRGNGVSGGFRPIQEALPKVLEQVEGKSAAAGERETSAPSAAEMGFDRR